MSFSSITQYDKKFDTEWSALPLSKKGTACSYFSLITAYRFLKDMNVSKGRHDENLESAVKYVSLVGTEGVMTFNELLTLSNIKKDDVLSTTPELIITDEIGFSTILDKDGNKSATIILKNEKFLVVLSKDKKYYIRDCHENEQVECDNYEECVKMLDSRYQLTQGVVIDGILFEEYSSIEFIKLSNPFDTELGNMFQWSNKLYEIKSETDDDKSGYIQTDDSISLYEHKSDDESSIFEEKSKQFNKFEYDYDLMNLLDD